MSKLRVNCFAVSLDGYGAGLDLPALGYRVTEHVSSKEAMHVLFEKLAVASR
jgi:hypothetical protein